MDQRIPRGWLGTSAGVFSLSDSDRQCGSYIAVEDAAEILQVRPESLSGLPSVRHGNRSYLTDRNLGRAWATGQIASPRSRFMRGNAMISFDELILMTLIERALPTAEIEPQYQLKSKLVDFRVQYEGQAVLLEFFGPYHFIQRSYRPPVHPLLRKRQLEDACGEECVIWPYWAQRCDANVQAVFDRKRQGIGSVWSTSAQFGDFAFDDSAQMIIAINERLNLARPDGVGYFYTDEYVAKPVHPVVRRIREGRESIAKLIPPGSTLPPRYWHPKVLWPLSPG